MRDFGRRFAMKINKQNGWKNWGKYSLINQHYWLVLLLAGWVKDYGIRRWVIEYWHYLWENTKQFEAKKSGSKK